MTNVILLKWNRIFVSTDLRKKSEISFTRDTKALRNVLPEQENIFTGLVSE